MTQAVGNGLHLHVASPSGSEYLFLTAPTTNYHTFSGFPTNSIGVLFYNWVKLGHGSGETQYTAS